MTTPDTRGRGGGLTFCVSVTPTVEVALIQELACLISCVLTLKASSKQIGSQWAGANANSESEIQRRLRDQSDVKSTNTRRVLAL